MRTLPAYEVLKRAHGGRRSIVHRARRTSDGHPLILKSLAMDAPSADDAARFRREFELLRSLEGAGTVLVHGMEAVADQPTIVMDDGGEALSTILGSRRIPLDEALALAVSTARALGALHRRGIVHKDIKPANIVVSGQDGAVRIIDFGIATRLTRERPSVRSPNVLEGTLRYMSPEQTGRTNRDIDARSDLYSLGVVLYELFTGAVPFASDDAAELVHQHIARAPQPPHEREPSLPRPLSALILRLLEKTVEDRYQSAEGLIADLEDLLAAARAGAEVAWSEPGARDISDRFQIPQKLYGREAEAAELVAAYERASRGRAELVLVGGYSGIGKTALVNELHRPVVARRGQFVGGKFEQLRREVPYASLVQAFTALTRHLLTETDEVLDAARAAITEAVGKSGRVLTDLIPELGAVIGPQPEVPALPPVEAQNRFNFTFLRFVKAIATDERPLAIFLDDLQWADLPSLKLIELLLGDPSVGRLLIVASYRDNEVTFAHPMRRMAEAAEKAGAKVSEIRLRPLTEEETAELVADALRGDHASTEPLAHLCFQRTAGNPFFLGQFLRSLHEDGLIAFDPEARAFRFDLPGIAARGHTENVVELMASQIQKLDGPARAALEIGACIGSQFDIATLARVSSRTPDQLVMDLDGPLVEGLVLPVDDGLLRSAEQLSLRFLHDRVQAAAYAQLDPDARRDIHHRVGRLWLDETPPAELRGRIFEIVNQLDLGHGDATPLDERLELARLNLLAAETARASSAAAPALHYARTGIALLPDDAFTRCYDLAIGLHAAAFHASFAAASFDELAARADLLLDKARTPLEKSRIYETRIYARTARGELMAAIEDGARALALLGIDLPVAVDFPRFQEGLGVTAGLLAGRGADALLGLPVTSSEEVLAAMRIFVAIASPAYLVNPLLSLHIYTEMFNLCLRHGLSEFAPFAFAVYGLIQSAVLTDLDTGYAYGKAALALSQRFSTPRVTARANVQVGLFIQHWKEPLRRSLPLFATAMTSGLEGGDLEYVGYAAIGTAMYAFFAGRPLDELVPENAGILDLLRRNGLSFAVDAVGVVQEVIQNLMREQGDPTVIEGPSFGESTHLAALLEAKNYSVLSLYHVLKAMLLYLFDDPAGAAAVAEKGEALISAQLGQFSGVELNFFQSLALLALAGKEEGEAREAKLAKVEKNQEAMKRWADHCPENSLHRHQLVEAERARVLGDVPLALSLYEQSVIGASRNGFLLDAALAEELTAKFYLTLGRERAGRLTLSEAAHGYAAWGGAAKVAQLQRRYPFMDRRGPASMMADATSIITSERQGTGTLLDLPTVLKAASVLSGEIVLDRLLDKVMEIAIVNAGAERGLLVLSTEGQLSIAAERHVGEGDKPALPARVEGSDLLSPAIVYYAARTGEALVLSDAAQEGLFTKDAYVAKRRPRSVLCAPLVNQGRLVALVYLENNLTAGAFTADRLELLRMLSAQAALSIQNAVLFASLNEHSRTLEQKVIERTRELSQRNDELGAALKQLRDAQKRLVTQEKLASLGALTAGIAHEIKNPLNFVSNFAELSADLAVELGETLGAERGRLGADLAEEVGEALEMLQNNLKKIREHGKRADGIINAMLMHSRSGEGRPQEETDLNALVAENVDLAYQAVRTKDPLFDLRIEKDYDRALPPVEVASGELGRVVINLVDNACYAMRERRKKAGPGYEPRLVVRTRNAGDRVELRLRDNGTGIAPAVLGQIFNPFFTTKPTGDGAGLGLSIGHDIVVGHGGEIRAESEEGEYTEMIVSLPVTSRRGTSDEAASDRRSE
ncbi:MAG: AAA family ATPase [Byssovorax sp.]